MLDRFFAINRNLCNKLEWYLPQARTKIFYLYEKIIAEYMNSKPNQVIIDVGGGGKCHFAKYKDPNADIKIISVDVSYEEMKNNRDVDEKIVANIMNGLPFEDKEVDLVVSRSVLEHLENLENFITNSKRILKKGGYFIHLFPSKFSPFALVNQMLPKDLSRKLLYFLIPESRGISGFPAFYDKCYYSAIKLLLGKHGFEIIDIHFSYYQSRYFIFFLPLFLISALYEILLRTIKIKNLCAYILVVARKK